MLDKEDDMELMKYPSCQAVDAEIQLGEPLLLLVAYNGATAIVAPIDEAVEHSILLQKVGIGEQNIDRYFRLVVDRDGADWTFVCPGNYKGIEDKARRLGAFYRDGFAIIPEALRMLGYLVGIDIPKRYRRHFDIMSGKL